MSEQTVEVRPPIKIKIDGEFCGSECSQKKEGKSCWECALFDAYLSVFDGMINTNMPFRCQACKDAVREVNEQVTQTELIDGANDCMTGLREENEAKDIVIKESANALEDMIYLVRHTLCDSPSYFQEEKHIVDESDKALAHAKEMIG